MSSNLYFVNHFLLTLYMHVALKHFFHKFVNLSESYMHAHLTSHSHLLNLMSDIICDRTSIAYIFPMPCLQIQTSTFYSIVLLQSGHWIFFTPQSNQICVIGFGMYIWQRHGLRCSYVSRFEQILHDDKVNFFPRHVYKQQNHMTQLDLNRLVDTPCKHLIHQQPRNIMWPFVTW